MIALLSGLFWLLIGLMQIEAWQQPSTELTESEWASYERKAKVFATSALCPKALRGKPNDVMAVALTARDLRMPFTLTTLGKFYVVDGKVEPAALLMTGLAVSRGHDIWTVHSDDERAVVAGTRAGSTRVQEFTFTIDQARRAGLLDEWWEEWYGDEQHRRVRKWVIVEGETPPAWVHAEKSKAEKKRNEAWWRFREDMLLNAATRRACRRVCPDVLLGLESMGIQMDSLRDIDEDKNGAETATAQVNDPEPVDILPDDDEPEFDANGDPITDADIVGEVPGEHSAGTAGGDAADPPAETAGPASGAAAADELVDEAWITRFAIGCREQGWSNDQRHALIHFATRGRVSSTKQVRCDEVPLVTGWFAGIVNGDYRWVETPEGWQIGPKA